MACMSKRWLAVAVIYLFVWVTGMPWASAAAMVMVTGGTFSMGDSSSAALADETPVRQVSVRNFYIGKYEVTFAQYDIFCWLTGRPFPNDEGWGREQQPVINVSWYDAVEYCNWLSGREGFTPVYHIQGSDVTCDFRADGYRLPTEAEWEYAAKGGGKSGRFLYSGDNNPDTVAWYMNNSGNRTHQVGKKRANELGIYDMSGNVVEWCWDRYGSYKKAGTAKPLDPPEGSARVLRGGGGYSFEGYVRTSVRGSSLPGSSFRFLGFRLARTAL